MIKKLFIMKSLFALILALMGCINKNIGTETKKGFNSLFCVEFGNFKEITLPYSAELIDSIGMTACRKEFQMNYLADYMNFSDNFEEGSSVEYKIIGKLKDTSNYYSVLYYAKYSLITPDHRIILATYSKSNYSVISKIILYEDQKPFKSIKSVLNKDLEIKSNLIWTYSWRDLGIGLPNEKYPGFIYITTQDIDYKVKEDGNIITSNQTEKKDHIGKFINGEFIYPLELPKKSIKN
jgi:hypothetical protein